MSSATGGKSDAGRSDRDKETKAWLSTVVEVLSCYDDSEAQERILRRLLGSKKNRPKRDRFLASVKEFELQDLQEKRDSSSSSEDEEAKLVSDSMVATWALLRQVLEAMAAEEDEEGKNKAVEKQEEDDKTKAVEKEKEAGDDKTKAAENSTRAMPPSDRELGLHCRP